MDSIASIRQVPRWSCWLTVLLFATQAAAESTLFEDAESPVARASVDFKIVIPKVLFLAVGTGSVGDLLPVRVAGNSGTITLNATTAGASDNSSGGTTGVTQVEASSSDARNLPPPVINDIGGASVALSSGKITDRTANWTYRYTAAAEAAPGADRARAAYAAGITYTASMR